MTVEVLAPMHAGRNRYRVYSVRLADGTWWTGPNGRRRWWQTRHRADAAVAAHLAAQAA